jgi:hypothetical protein
VQDIHPRQPTQNSEEAVLPGLSVQFMSPLYLAIQQRPFDAVDCFFENDRVHLCLQRVTL